MEYGADGPLRVTRTFGGKVDHRAEYRYERGKLVASVDDDTGYVAHPPKRHNAYSYDAQGKLLTIEDEHGPFMLHYDEHQRVSSVGRATQTFARYTRDAQGRVTVDDGTERHPLGYRRYVYDCKHLSAEQAAPHAP